MIKMRQVENKRNMARPGDFYWHTPTKKKRFLVVAMPLFSVDGIRHIHQWQVSVSKSIPLAGFCHWDGNVEQPSIDQIDRMDIQIAHGTICNRHEEEIVFMTAPGEAVRVE